MFVAEITWKISANLTTDAPAERLLVVSVVELRQRLDEISYGLLGSLYQNGQIIGQDYPIAKCGKILRAFVTILESDALDLKYANKSVKMEIQKAIKLGLTSPTTKIIGESLGLSEGHTCNCQPDSYILCTDFIEHGSPIKCGLCFADIPLYHLPKTDDSDSYYNILMWAADYRACDTLQMNCKTGERFGLRQMSDPHSSLAKEGREICDRLTALTTKPTYYNLHRYKAHARLVTEKQRKCPSCNGEWLLDKPWHRYDFKCDRCRLVSNIAL
jgi:predicted  nucleic acid-binding Zn ribbon protein